MADAPALGTLIALYPSVPVDALRIYLEHYGDEGGPSAWAMVREDDRYEMWFPGNLTDEGEVRYAETNYSAILDSYDDVYRNVGIDPKWLAGQYGNLIRGEKSPAEFAADVNLVNDRIISASDAVKQWYANEMDIEGISTQALLLAHLDPSLESGILEGTIQAAEVGGTAADFGFDMGYEAVETLLDRDMTKAVAAQTFGAAKQVVPIMQVLAKRHADPDDEFDINDFLASEIFQDPDQNYRMRRLVAQERSDFSSGLKARQNQTGALTGLTAE